MHGMQRAVSRRAKDSHSRMPGVVEVGGQWSLQALQALRALRGLTVLFWWAGGGGAWELHRLKAPWTRMCFAGYA